MNVEEFKSKVLIHKDKCYRSALRILNDYEDAKDALQEVFLRLWEKREKLANHSNIEAFAMLTTKNLCIDKIRSSKKYLKDYNFENLVERSKIVEISEAIDSIEKVKLIIESLPLQQKMVIHLCDIEGLSIDKETLIKEYSFERY